MPDLQVGSLVETAVQVEPGAILALDLPVVNGGTATLGAVDLGVSLWLKPASGGSDLHLGDRVISISDLTAGTATSSLVGTAIPLHMPPGQYFLSMELDRENLIPELNNGNNSRVSGSAYIEVGGITVAQALGQPTLAFSQNPGVSWFGQDLVGIHGGAAVATPSISVSEQVWFQTVIDSDSTVTFRWKADTSELRNKAVFQVNGVEEASISGQTGWERVKMDLFAGDILRWSYTQGADTEEDFVWIDGLQITAQNLPDFAVIGAVYPAGEYVLQRVGDRLEVTATGINLGTTTSLPSGFKMSAYLSPTSVLDVGTQQFLGDLTLFRGLDANNRFVYRSSLPLPDTLAAGAYHLVLIVNGNGLLAESDVANNIYISPSADIRVERRPNLQVTDLDYTGGLYLQEDELSFGMTVTNAGLADVPAGLPFNLSLFLAADSATGAGQEIELVTFQESLGIAVGESVTYEITVGVPENISLGMRYFAGGTVDVTGAVSESNEQDNRLLSADSDLIFGEVTLEAALDIMPGGADVLSNPIEGTLSWFGQTGTSSDGIDAAQSPDMRDGEVAGFGLDVEVPDLTVVSFFWSVSSERMEFENGVKEDYLAFFIDGVEAGRISGEVDWRQESFVLEPGSRNLSWRYVKDGSESGGLDRAWVDQIVYQRPDLLVVGEPTAPAGNLHTGESFTVSFDVGNGGQGASPDFQAELVLSTSRVFDDVQNVALGQFMIAGLAPGETRSISHTVNIPENMQIPGDYFVGVRLNQGFVIPESNPNNNIAWSAAADYVVTVPVSLEEAIDLEELNPGAGLAIQRGGDGIWYGQEVEFDPSVPGNIAAGKSPTLAMGKRAWFEMEVEGPAVVDFRVKAETGHVANLLRVSVDGTEKASVFGSEEWASHRILAPAATNTIRWSYIQGSSLPGHVYVDRVKVSVIDQPDFVIQSAEYLPGEYVLTRDKLRLIAVGLNQGETPTEIGSDLKITAKLVKERTVDAFDQSTILLGDLKKSSELNSDNRFVYQADLGIPADTPAGHYHLALKIDTPQAEFDKANNFYFSASPDVEVVRLPDLVVTNLSHTGGDFIYGDELQLSFTVKNQGQADLTGTPFKISLLLTPNRVLNLETDDLLSEFTESGDLSVGKTRTYRTTVEIPDTVRVGELLSLGVYVDSGGAVRESLENNNTRISDRQDILVGEVPLDVAVDDVGTAFSTSGVPWFGQTKDSFDGVDAARSGKIGDGEISTFETTLNLTAPSIVSFYWKVSSERTLTPEGEVKEDYLRFSINGQERARISGEVGWRRVSFPVGAGTSVLSWSYIKDLTESMREDAGWVDGISYLLPDLVVESIEVGAGTYIAGQPLNVKVTIRNQGLADVPTSLPFTVMVRLSGDNSWGGSGKIDLGSFGVNSGLAHGESRTLPAIDFLIPEGIALDGTFFIGAMVDFGNYVVETNEENNVRFSKSADITLKPAIALEVALDDADNEDDDLPPGWLSNGWKTSGDKPWFGQGDRELGDGTFSTFDGEDSAQSGRIGVNESSLLEREVDAGPSVIKFRWKVSSMPNANFLRFSISGKEMGRISGDVDWTDAQFFVPAGRQVLQWEYVKTNGQVVGADAGFLDTVSITKSNKPDLVISNVEFTSGDYVLQRDTLRIRVTVRNQGAPLGIPGIKPSDLGVRLSTDNEWGNSDDIILGNFARVDTFDSGNRMVFDGEIHLPAHIPAREYYLALLVDPFEELVEYSRENNLFVSEGPVINIRRLPNLTWDPTRPAWFDSSKIYYPLSILKMDLSVINAGLGDIPGGKTFKHQVHLWGIETGEDLGPWDWNRDGVFIKTIGTLEDDAYMPGVTAGGPGPYSISYETFMTLPDELAFLKLIGAVPADADYATEEEKSKLGSWTFALSVVLDSENAIEESDEMNRRLVLGEFKVNQLADIPDSLEAWAALHGINLPSDTGSAEYAESLKRYALGRGPNDSVAPTQAGLIEVNGAVHFRITFDVLHDARDITYAVSAGSSVDNMSIILPSLDPSHPIDINTHQLIVSAAPSGNTTTVTVKDIVPAEGISSRFMSVTVKKK